MTTTDRPTAADMRILHLAPEHYDVAVCLLCGQYGENVDWYETWSPEHTRVWSGLYDILTRHGIGGDRDTTAGPIHDLVFEISVAVDPIGDEYGTGPDAVCTTCAALTGRELRARIRAHADQLDEAGYWGPDSDDLADPDLRDRGLWVRRHAGYELAIEDGPDAA